MTLTPGTRLGPYDITAAIGEGGMGQVYRATDAKLKRQVAIKVLPPALAVDADRLARFQREAEVLAALNHPNIAAIYGLEESPSTGSGQAAVHALVMELVEGDDLSQRIAQGALPIDDALRIAKQIAEALEAAHDQGIVHRDLKPANIKVRADGTVKVLDFGLAKAMDSAGASGVNVANSPTLTAHATALGMIMGTAAYMAPEQAKGKAVDKRADIWAFGIVFYEMLAGRAAFAGETVTDIIAAVVTREPEWTALPAATPTSIRRLLARCLEKDPKRRVRDIGDVRFEIEEILARGSSAPRAAEAMSDRSRLAGATRAEQLASKARWGWGALPWVIAAAAAVAAGWTLWGSADTGTIDRRPTHVEIGFPRDVEPSPASSGAPAIASDGRTVAMIGVSNGVRRAFVRRLDRPETIALPGDGANGVAFSPDGVSVAIIYSSGQITRISLADQQRKDLTSGADVTGQIVWSHAGIIFGRGGALWVVSTDGSPPRALTELDLTRHEVAHYGPVVLPGERLLLFASHTTEPGAERIESVPIDGGPRSVVVERATTPVWSPTGHLLFSRDGAVLAMAFDARTGVPSGTAVPVVPSREIEALATGQLTMSLSDTGSLLFAPAGFAEARVVSVSPDGETLTLETLPSDRYTNPRIAPDGRRLLVEVGGSVIEAVDLGRGTRARLTAAALSVLFTTWNADGTHVVFRRFGVPFWAATNGSGDARPVTRGTVSDYPSSPGPDPDSMIVLRVSPETSGDVFLMSMSGAFEPKPLIATPAYEGGPQLSPDGRWLLYQSDATGRPEIYVRRFPSLDRPWQVSDGGGIQARWSRNNREIYYRSGQLMVSVSLDASGRDPVFGKPVALFRDDYDFGAGATIPNYDVTADGRFIMIRRGTNGGKLRLVANWTEELKRILASGGVH